GPAGVRDADRRRDQGPARRPPADARIRDRAVDAAFVGGADRRQGPPWSRARSRPAGAAAAGIATLSDRSKRRPRGRRFFVWPSAALTFLNAMQLPICEEVA